MLHVAIPDPWNYLAMCVLYLIQLLHHVCDLFESVALPLLVNQFYTMSCPSIIANYNSPRPWLVPLTTFQTIGWDTCVVIWLKDMMIELCTGKSPVAGVIDVLLPEVLNGNSHFLPYYVVPKYVTSCQSGWITGQRERFEFSTSGFGYGLVRLRDARARDEVARACEDSFLPTYVPRYLATWTMHGEIVCVMTHLGCASTLPT